MARITAPLLSFDARGKIGNSLVFSNWKGQKYARQHVVPSNPRTTAQTNTRTAFKWVHEAFKYMPAAVQANWNTYAQGKMLSGPNAWAQANISALIAAANITDITFAKPVNGGPGGATPTLTPAAGQLTVATPDPVLPAGWTVVENIVVAMKQQAPTDEVAARSNHSGVDTSSPYSVVLTGLTGGQAYVVGSFFSLTDPSGKPAYTGSVNVIGTPA